MKTVAAIFCALLAAVSALAQQGAFNIIKQQANNAAGNESGGQPPAAHPSAPPTTPQPNPMLEATLQNIASLRVGFEKFASNPTNTPPLANDLAAAAQGAKASKTSVAKLAGHLASALAGKNLHGQEQKLAQGIHAIFNSARLSATQQQMMFDGVQKILSDGGVPSDDVANVINDLKTIAAETG